MLLRRSLLSAPIVSVMSACRRSGRKRIGVVPKATSHLFFVTIHAGVNKAASDFNVDVIWNGPSEETDHARQIQIVDSMITQRVDGLAISATDERALAGVVKKAMTNGIPVTLFDSGTNVDGYVSFIATDNHGAGVTAARTLARLIGNRGDVGMVMHKPGGTSTLLREQGFEETMSREFPDVKIVARQFGMSDEARSLAVAENILSAHPKLAGIFASSEASSLGAMQAIKLRGVSGKVRLITFDSSKTHVESLRNGTIDVMLVQDAFRIGYESVRSLAVKLVGGSPAQRMDLPARAIVKADLDKPEVRALLAGAGQEQ